jgi:thioredoxin-related protein
MKLLPAIFLTLSLMASASLAETSSTEQVLTGAKSKAAAEQKVIFVHFGASWCGWCKKLDAYLERPDVKPVFEKYFVPVKLVMGEQPPQKALENAGADDLAKKLGGPGFPFLAFLDAQGTLIVNSNREPGGQNIGYPSEPAEVDWFLQMVKKAAPKITADDLKTLETPLRTPAPTASGH